jgi:hypothetical protein
MSSSLEATLSAASAPGPAAAQAAPRRVIADIWVYLVIAGLVIGAWLVSRLGLFKAGDDVGYWIGVVGGVMMLMLFSYPLRKYVRGLHRLGKVKWWFMVHMVLGIGGPLLILIHSTFRVGSLNAAVALYSMLIVAGSGVIGRFLYMHVNRGLSGERTNLAQLQARAGLDQSEARSKLHFAPEVEARLLKFAEHELDAKRGWFDYLRQVTVLPMQQRMVYRACVSELRIPLAAMARGAKWSRQDYVQRKRLARKLVKRYLDSVVKVAQFTAYERAFALWHIAHVPFVYLLVISAIIHVIAVHAY